MKSVFLIRPMALDAQLPSLPSHCVLGADDADEVAVQLEGICPRQRNLLVGLRRVEDVLPQDICMAVNGQRYRDRLVFAPEEYWIVSGLLRYLDDRRIKSNGALRVLLHMPNGKLYFPVLLPSGDTKCLWILLGESIKSLWGIQSRVRQDDLLVTVANSAEKW